MSNFEAIEERTRWNNILSKFKHTDIYYEYDYVKAMQIHGDGQPFLLYFEGSSSRMCYAVMKKDISNDGRFYGRIEAGDFFDLETPYGYGGPLVEGNFDQSEEVLFWNQMEEYCRKEHIISQFIRFHPLFHNAMYFRELDKTVTLKKTVYMDTTSEEGILKDMGSNKRKVRKALKNGVHILFDHGERLENFIQIYQITMQFHEADHYYYFQKSYYQYLIQHLSDQILFFYALYEDKIVSAAMFFLTKEFMHYHLSGTLREYSGLAAMNLLFYEAALYAHRQGICKLHLGGGLTDQDSLFRFKKQFHEDGTIPFYIGRSIFDRDKYEYLLELRKQEDPDFRKDNNFLIQYRR